MRVFFLVIFMVISPLSAMSCSVNQDASYWIEKVSEISKADICSIILSGVEEKEIECNEGKRTYNETRVIVTDVSPRDGFLKAHFSVLAPSEKLAGSGRYENHQYVAIFFLNFNCMPSFWIVNHRPRYHRGWFQQARGAEDINWEMFEETDELENLQAIVKNWLVEGINRKIYPN